MSIYVLVHGAWHGGWCWSKVRAILESQGHRVYTPTMTGLGERAHLLSERITMDMLVMDIANVLKVEDLDNVILVGHSFGGAVISGVAESVPSRIKQLIYLDAAILENGESMFGCMPAKVALERQRIARIATNSLSLPTPSAEDLGIVDEKQWQYVKRNLSPHPLSSYLTPLKLKNLPGKGFSCDYIAATNPYYEALEWSRLRVKQYGWPITSIDTGHDAMISAPEKLSNILVKISNNYAL